MKQVLVGQDELVGRWICGIAGGTWAPGDVAMGLVEVSASSPSSPKLVAGVLFNQFNGASIQMHVAALPDSRWLSKSYLGVLFGYAFRQCKVRKVIGLVAANNVWAANFVAHVGFELEATLKDTHPTGDLRVFTMTRENCKWLSLEPKPGFLYGQI